jgi:hypothetical protein
VELVKFLEKNKKLRIQIKVVTLKVTSCRIMSKKQNWKKVKNQDSMGKTNFLFSYLPFSPWVVLATWLHVGVPQKIQIKLNIQPILNKNSPWAHTELELDMLGVAKKLVKYVVHLSIRNN